MDYTVHGILQARMLEWVAFSFSRGSSQPRDPTQVSHIAGGMTIQAWSKSNRLWLYSGSDKQSQGIRLDRRVPEERRILDTLQEAMINIPKKEKSKRAKCLSEEALQIAE